MPATHLLGVCNDPASHVFQKWGVVPGTMGSCGFQLLVPTASNYMLTPVLGCLLALRTSSMPQVSSALCAHASVTLLSRSLSSSYSLQPDSSSMHCPAVTFCCIFLLQWPDSPFCPAATAANVPLSQTASYTFASAGYVPMGLNFISRKSSEAGVSASFVALLLLLCVGLRSDAVHLLSDSCTFMQR